MKMWEFKISGIIPIHKVQTGKWLLEVHKMLYFLQITKLAIPNKEILWYAETNVELIWARKANLHKILQLDQIKVPKVHRAATIYIYTLIRKAYQ